MAHNYTVTQFSSVQWHSHVCDPMDCSMPGFPVHHQLPELAQTHVHRARNAIQPSHPLSAPFPPAIFPSIRVFSNESVLCISWSKYWSFSFSTSPSSEYSVLISFRINWFDLLAVQGTLRVFSCTTVHTIHGVLEARILKWFAILFSSGPCSVRTLHHDPVHLGWPYTAWLIISLS